MNKKQLKIVSKFNLRIVFKYNCLIIVLLFIIVLFNPLYSEDTVIIDELDSIIRKSISKSLEMKTISNQLKISELSGQNTWLSLMPDLSFNAGYDNSRNPIDNSIMVNDNDLSDFIGYSLSISKSLSDVDSIYTGIVISKNTLLMEKIQAELNKRKFISEIIKKYAAICTYQKEKELKEFDIKNNEILLQIMEIKYKNGTEIPANLEKLSNDIILSKEEMNLDKIDYKNHLSGFINLTGQEPEILSLADYSRENYKTTAQFIESNNQINLDIQIKEMEISNNLIMYDKKWRELFIPILSLNGGYGYDLKNRTASYSVNLSISFLFLDYFQRQNEREKIRLENENKKIGITNSIIQINENMSYIMQKIHFLQKKIELYQDNIKMNYDMIELIRYQYETDKIDYFDYKNKLEDFMSQELLLIQTESELYVLIKCAQYGILNT